MHTQKYRSAVSVLLLFCCFAGKLVQAQNTAFTYQGRLSDNGAPANGAYDLQFSLFGVDSGGSPLAGPVSQAPVNVSGGIFQVTLDFGAGNFDGNNRWLQIGVRTNGSASAYTPLAPRQPITAAPYAITAAKLAGNPVLTNLVSFNPPVGAPFLVGSTNQVTNLNADLLDGLDATAFLPAAGGTLTGNLTNNSGAGADSIFSEGGIDRPATNAQTFALTNSGTGRLALLVKNEVRAGTGSATAPAFSFAANTNTGAFNPASNAVAFATGGTERLRISTNGNVGIGTSTPAAKLEVVGSATVGGLFAMASSPASVSLNGTISPVASHLILTASSVVTLSATTAIFDASVPGTFLILEGSSDINTITIPNNANTKLGANRILGDGDTLTLIFDGIRWVEVSYANN